MTAPSTSLGAALAALDDAALEAAASKGLVRRAHRDHEAGLASVTRVTLDAADLSVDGEVVALSATGLGAARCSCPAQGLCRHILAAIIAVRGRAAAEADAALAAGPASERADPLAELAAFEAADLVKTFGRAALRDAEIILAAATELPEAIAIETSGRTCLIRLPGQPEVRYLGGLGLAGMIAKEPAPVEVAGTTGKPKRKRLSGEALRAAAVLAARRRHAGEVAPVAAEDGGSATTVVAPPPTDTAFLDAVTEALAEAARAGLATAPLLLEERLLDLALSSRADALPRLAGALRGIAEDLSERRARAAAFEPAAALAAIARTYALVLALRQAGDKPILRGAVRQPYADLGTLDLVGCGLELWRTPLGARGATAYALAPGRDGPGWVTLSLARAAGQDPFFRPARAVRSDPVWGRSLETLANGRFRLDNARATADGRLSLGGETRMTMGDGGLAALLEIRPDLFVEDWSSIESRLASHFAPSLLSTVRAVPLALRPTAIEAVQFDAIEQRAWLPVMDRAGHWLELTIGGDTGEMRLDALAAMLAKGVPRVIVAIATREAALIALSPIAAMTDGSDALQSFDLGEPQRAVAERRTMIDRLKVGVGALATRQRTAAAFAPLWRDDAASALIAHAEDEALALAELGGRMEDRARLDTLARIASELDGAGLSPLAALLSGLATSTTRERPLRLLAFVHAAACHAALTLRAPMARRIR